MYPMIMRHGICSLVIIGARVRIRVRRKRRKYVKLR